MSTNIQTTNGNGGQLARRGQSDLKSFLNSPEVINKLAEAASAAMKPEDLVRLALMAASRSPDLAKCTRDSILRSLLDAAALGIQPGGLMGRGYLVARKNNKNGTVECSFDPGWRGLIDIARRTGQIRRIEAHVVHEKDDFEIMRTPLTTIRHKESKDDNPGPVTHAYAAAEFTNGSVQIEIVSKRDLDKVRKMGAQNGPWASWYDEMARKTAVRRLCKFLPYDPMLDQAIRMSDESDNADGTQVMVDTRKPKRSLAERMAPAQAGAMLPEHDEDGVVVDAAELAPTEAPPADEMDPEPEESKAAGREPGED